MYLEENFYQINMLKFSFEDVQFDQSETDIMKILEKVLFWCQKWILKNLGEF